MSSFRSRSARIAAVPLAFVVAAMAEQLAAQSATDSSRPHKSVYGKLESVDDDLKGVFMRSDAGEKLAWRFSGPVVAEVAKFKRGDPMIVIYRLLSPSEKRVTAIAFPGTADTPVYVNRTGFRVVLRSGPAVNGACGGPPPDPASIHESTIMNGGQADAQDACWCCAVDGEMCTPSNKTGLGRAILVGCFQ